MSRKRALEASRATMKKVFLIVLTWITLLSVIGCGGGGGGSSSITTGRVAVAINWPGRSRYIPPYANSVVCRITASPSKTYTLTLNRTGDSAYQGTAMFAQGIPVGNYTMIVSAYPEANGVGSVVAQAQVGVSVTAGQTSTVDVTADMQTTIDHLVINGTPLAVNLGSTLTVSARAVSASNQTILLPQGALTYSVVSGAGSIDPQSGLFTPVSAGTTRIRATESGLSMSVEADISVIDANAGGTLSVNVDWPGRSRYVPPYANSIVCTLTIGPGDTYTITINRSGDSASTGSGTFGQSFPAGTYSLAVVAKSETNGGGSTVASATASVTIQTGQQTVKNVSADLQSVIHHLVIDGQPLATQIPNTLAISGHAEDASNNLILLPSGALTWDIPFGTSYGSINATTGLFTPLSPGTATVRLREVGANKSVTASVTVTAAPIITNIYVADSNNLRIAKFTSMAGADWTVFNVSSASLSSVAFDSAGRMYWADDVNDAVYRANADGSNIVSYGTSGDGIGQFSGPCSVAIDSSNRIYIADRFNNRVVRINDMSGAGWTVLGGFGSGVGKFVVPEGVFIRPNGKLYVADTGNCRIVETDGMTTNNWTELGGVRGSGTGEFDNPTAVYVSSSGAILVADSMNNRIVKVSDIAGSGWLSFGGPDPGSGTGQFDYPNGVSMDSGGRIYISDQYNNRVVRIADMSGSGWTELGTYGSGTNQFDGPRGVTVR